MSNCCYNEFKKNLDWDFLPYDPPGFPITRTLYWHRKPINSFEDYVANAHYFRDYLRLKSTLLRRQHIFWYIPLEQGYQLIQMFRYPVPTFWVEANLRVGDNPVPTEPRPYRSMDEAIAFADETAKYLILNPVY